MVNMRFQDKTAIVTGGAHGMGRALVERFVREGAGVVLADWDAGTAHSAAEAIRAAHPGCRVVVAATDVGDEQQVKAMVELAVWEFGRVDVLINNAGVYMAKPLERTAGSDIDSLLASNLKGPILCCKYVIPHMRRAGAGAIVNVSSIGGVVAMEGSPVYVASKSALVGFNRALALDLAPQGIRVNCVAPGWCDTRMIAPFVEDPLMKTALLTDVPLKRLSSPEEQAHLIVWLASDEASYVIGQTIVCDGGWTIR